MILAMWIENEKTPLTKEFLMRKHYSVRHQHELKIFTKAVHCMNANGIKAADHTRIADELQHLLNGQVQLRASLAEQNVAPDLIDHIRFCIDTVIKVGEKTSQ